MLLFSPAGADPVRPSPDLVQSIARKTIPEFVELLSLPNDENLRLGHYLDGICAFAGLLRRPYPAATK